MFKEKNPICKILSGKKVFIHYFFLILCISTAKKKCKLCNHESVIIKFHFICKKIRKCAFCMFISIQQYLLFLMQLVNIRHSLKHVFFLFLDVFLTQKNSLNISQLNRIIFIFLHKHCIL